MTIPISHIPYYEQFYSTKEVAWIFHVTPETVQFWARNGYLHPIKLPQRKAKCKYTYRYARSDIDHLIHLFSQNEVCLNPPEWELPYKKATPIPPVSYPNEDTSQYQFPT